jgi:hypothetical protein
MPEISRRHFVGLASAGAAATWLGFERSDLLAAGLHAVQAQRFETLSVVDAADLEAAAAQIIPSDATPGAREARVIYFIDRAISSFARDERQATIDAARELRDRARKLDPSARSFAALRSDRQIAVLTAMEHEKSPAFMRIRGATVAGMLANPEYGGNFAKAGWQWIGFNDQFSWATPFGWYDANA